MVSPICERLFPKQASGTTNASLNVAGRQVKVNSLGLWVREACEQKKKGGWGQFKKGEGVESDAVDIYL